MSNIQTLNREQYQRYENSVSDSLRRQTEMYILSSKGVSVSDF